MESDINPTEDAPHAANAVSIFGSAGNTNDFPVLKAFQEYIDAEQAKARKRMLGLSIFFILLLVVVVVTFTLVMTSVINRNQALSDRLLDIALREKTQAQPVVNVQPPAPQPVVQPVIQQPSQADVLKPVLEKFDKLAEAMVKAQQQQHVPVAAPAPVVVTTAAAPSPATQPSAESTEIARLREELRREIEARKEQEAKAKEEKRKAEIEAHRRRLYPEYYARQVEPNPVPVKVTPQLQQPLPATKLRGITPINYFNTEGEDPELAQLLSSLKQQSPRAAPAPLPAPAVKNPLPAKPVPKPTATAAVPAAPPPVAEKKQFVSQAKTVPMRKTETLSINGTKDGSSIPWLIEQPKK